jgi:hypothetical protein
MLVLQIALSFAFILLIRDAGYGITEQAAGAPVALLLVLLLTSFVKARVLGRLLGAPVSPMRWPLLWAALAGGAVGGAFTLLPPGWRWMQVSVGVVATMGAYLFVIWRYAFGPEDRALFNTMPSAEEATLPNEGSFIR